MERRRFLTQAGAGMAAGALAAPAAAAMADLPILKWRLASSFPKSLDSIHSSTESLARQVALLTGGRFQIQVFAAGELVPSAAVLDAVKDGTVEIGHSASYYYVGKDPTFALDTGIPFGLNSRQQMAWMHDGGGLELLRDFFREYAIHNIPCGATGTQMGGWFRKEIRSVEDLKGLKFRVGGFAGQVLARLGVVPQQIPAGDIYAALEKGAIDAAEWVGPYDDLKLGFQRVAKYYYYPGFWEGGPQLTVYVNLKHWNALPPEYQAALENACALAHVEMQARYDARSPAALRQLIASGTQLRPFSHEIMSAAYQAAHALYDETAAKNPRFRKIYEPWKKFRDDQLQWFAVAESHFDAFMQATRAAARSRK
ncbi:MAG TPA: TRAP transporter substrate-binding protein [Zoogloea sp.]|uniref:TRAP transporter substrate-binding protein n=1 Tax=Zoogloea sp. TaxID=49181 RepID=UPI002B7D8947|nr:TRAP transporter substrate-binding protein [Zoogloea sp.]HMY49139.1 TRAP transporter substrate-binding protein [Rhodocyclaceae bacterium]HMZ75620.1 TRAP transporter substrate-binding protein [Rhodocyclaceae bacterium]HNF61682.1 TRAP transporter substrate-binding protein [Rhodocyclaceae bacterium]HNI47162.1 TRAP transporter substrate-binding protein [Zoogloea sp.]